MIAPRDAKWKVMTADIDKRSVAAVRQESGSRFGKRAAPLRREIRKVGKMATFEFVVNRENI